MPAGPGDQLSGDEADCAEHGSVPPFCRTDDISTNGWGCPPDDDPLEEDDDAPASGSTALELHARRYALHHLREAGREDLVQRWFLPP